MAIDLRSATLSDLDKGQFLFVRCGARIDGNPCGHTGVVMPATLPPRFNPHTRLIELHKHLTCRKCGRKSRETAISVWHR